MDEDEEFNSPADLKELGCALIENAHAELLGLNRVNTDTTRGELKIILSSSDYLPSPYTVRQFWSESVTIIIDFFQLDISIEAIKEEVEPLIKRYEERYPSLSKWNLGYINADNTKAALLSKEKRHEKESKKTKVKAKKSRS